MPFRGESGSVAVIFAIVLPALLIGVGGSIEASRAIAYRQRLASAAELACTQAQAYINARKRQDVTSSDKTKLYPASDVQPIADRVKTAKALGTSAALSAVNNTDVNVHVSASGTMKIIFSSVLNNASVDLAASRDCSVISTTAALSSSGTPQLLFTESFERPTHSVNYNDWSVLGGVNNGKTWNGWTTINAGIEINGQRELASNVIRFGDFFAELDSDCGTSANTNNRSCRSNSTMSRYMDLIPGNYQIRYWYIARERDANQPGKVICGAKDSDVSWYQVNGQTNRIEVYVERSGNYTFSSSSMVDVCVQADAWTERVISFVVPSNSDSSATQYRISWRAAGKEDTYGGLIDYIRICRNTCPN
ncbi:TadE/TadG family type IV pilus assembly protein [Methylobacterium terricola]|nr:TadE/TadG family type IV pilus assembly protein [Methylobacterium terricola]